jgi:Integrase core domain/gag-polypeptide of LTR copia-type/GAG-pre-integrase domain
LSLTSFHNQIMTTEGKDSSQRLTNFLFNGENYRPWARAATVALGGKGKDGYITGSTPKPEAKETAKLAEWVTNDLFVLSLLFNSMEPRIYEIFAYATSAKELWDSLYEMYGQAQNASRVFELQQSIINTKQTEKQSFTEYLGVMRRQWEELRQLRPVASTVQEYQTREEHDRIFQLLSNLSPTLEEVRRNILLRPELPTFNTVCSIIQSEETRRRVMTVKGKVESDTTEVSAHYIKSGSKVTDAKGKWKSKQNNGRKFHCDHCNREGHTKDRCWVLYPHLRQERGRSSGANANVAETDTDLKAQVAHLSKQMRQLMTSQKNDSEDAQLETGLMVQTGNNLICKSQFVRPKTNYHLLNQPANDQIGKIDFSRNQIGLITEATPKQVQTNKSLKRHEPLIDVRPNWYAFSSFRNSKIIVDSGATDNMCSDHNLLNNMEPSKLYQNVTVANGSKVPIIGTGTKELFNREIDFLVTPDLKTNLLSVSKCTKLWNCNIIFTPNKVVFQDRLTKMTIGEGHLRNGLYVLDFNNLVFSTTKDQSILWHWRLGHPSDRVLKTLDCSFSHHFNNCDICHFAKQHRLPFPEHFDKSDNLFDIVHSDVWGYAPTNSREGFRYFVIFIDDKSRATWLYLLKNKHEVLDYFKDFCNMVKNQFSTSIKILRTDNGTEYTNLAFQEFTRRLGITHQTSCVGTPQQNGVSERKNRHLLEVARALLFSANLLKIFWADAILTSCYLINRLPSRILNFKSPFEILHGRKYTISHLRVFGCICYVHIQDSGKLDPRAKKCIFLGYSSTKKGYKCYDPNTNKTYISRDVIFNEEQMFYKTQTQNMDKDYTDIVSFFPENTALVFSQPNLENQQLDQPSSSQPDLSSSPISMSQPNSENEAHEDSLAPENVEQTEDQAEARQS